MLTKEEENRIKEKYKDLNVDAIVAEVDKSVAEGRSRRASKAEIIKLRLAALKSLRDYYQNKIDELNRQELELEEDYAGQPFAAAL